MFNRSEQRKIIREKRRALSIEQRQEASRRVCQQLEKHVEFARARRIAGFLAFDGEIDVADLLDSAIDAGKEIYLPVILSKKAPMAFAPYHPAKPLRRNYFNILEPDVETSQYLLPEDLDLVLTPLVAFDETCNRLGVGGGFYDRTFAFLNAEPKTEVPGLLGVAYDMQKLPTIPVEPWDVPLRAVVTETQTYSR